MIQFSLMNSFTLANSVHLLPIRCISLLVLVWFFSAWWGIVLFLCREIISGIFAENPIFPEIVSLGTFRLFQFLKRLLFWNLSGKFDASFLLFRVFDLIYSSLAGRYLEYLSLHLLLSWNVDVSPFLAW